VRCERLAEFAPKPSAIRLGKALLRSARVATDRQADCARLAADDRSPPRCPSPTALIKSTIYARPLMRAPPCTPGRGGPDPASRNRAPIFAGGCAPRPAASDHDRMQAAPQTPPTPTPRVPPRQQPRMIRSTPPGCGSAHSLLSRQSQSGGRYCQAPDLYHRRRHVRGRAAFRAARCRTQRDDRPQDSLLADGSSASNDGRNFNQVGAELRAACALTSELKPFIVSRAMLTPAGMIWRSIARG